MFLPPDSSLREGGAGVIFTQAANEAAQRSTQEDQVPLFIEEIDITVNNASPGIAAPTLQGQGYNVEPYSGSLLFEFYGLDNVDDYSFEFYGTADDNDPATGHTTFPDGETWPLLDTLSRTKTGTFMIWVPLQGLGRLYPRLAAWTQTLSADSTVKYSARLVD